MLVVGVCFFVINKFAFSVGCHYPPPPFYCLFDLIIVNNWRMSDKGYKICSIHVCSTASIDGVTIHRLETRADVKVFSGQFLTSSIPRY